MAKTEYEASLPIRFLVAGCAACFADNITYPFDTIKVRLQLQGEGAVKGAERLGLIGIIHDIGKNEGYLSLYNGLLAGLQRQMCFAAIKLGAYDYMKNLYTHLLNRQNHEGIVILPKVLAGLTTGALPVLFAQPTDVIKIRLQAQGKVKKYKSTLHAYKLIYLDDGLPGLWIGWFPNLIRNSIVTAVEIIVYDITKDILIQEIKMKDNLTCHLTCAILTAFIGTTVASPIDVVKTRYMNAPIGRYTNATDCITKMAKQEGYKAFYKGFIPSYLRTATWNLIMWTLYEHLCSIFFTKI